jgi:lipopolysaccharide heptosyltransferase II
MNILQILPELNVGGVETGTIDLAKYLVRYGHKAVVVSAGGELVKELESVGGIHYQLPVHKKSIFSILRSIPKLVQIIKKENIEIVHARSRVPAWAAYLAARRTGVVFITTCHGYYRKHPFSYVMGWAKRVIVLSNVIGRHMIDDFNCPHERIRLVPRSVDLEKFTYLSPDEKRKEDFNVGIIGRITPLKGHTYFIKAMAKAVKSIPNLKIWIIGDAPESKGTYKEQLQILVKRLGLGNSTQFLGNQRDIPGILASLDLVVMATTTPEAFGRVIIEAQAAGVPVVATQVGGAADIIEDGRTGQLVPPADADSIAEATVKIFQDKKLAALLAQAAFKKVKEQYNVERMVNSTLAIYTEALSHHKLLIIKLSSLGDIILSSAALRAIREKFNSLTSGHHYAISLLVNPEYKDCLIGCPYIDELLMYDFKEKDKGIGGLLRLGKDLARKNFDIVIDLQNNRTSHILSRLSLSLNRYGYANKKFGFLLNHGIPDEKPFLDPITHQFRILNLLGIDLKNPALELWPRPEDEEYIDEFLKSQWLSANQKLIGINMSASSRWATKSWPFHHLVRLCEALGQRAMRLVITGTEKDACEAGGIHAVIKSTKPIIACGKTTVNQLSCLIKRCSVYVCTDSAPLHIAAAMKVPFVALFGATDPRRHLPPVKNGIVIRKDLECAPCYKPQCRHKQCMDLITPEEVLEAIDKLLT